MRRIDWVLLLTGVGCALLWSLFSGKDGFKGTNATIVARSIPITSTIDGRVDNDPPSVGDRVKSSDLLVRIHNNRIDQGRLVEYESEIKYLNREISSLETRQSELSDLLERYQQKAAAHYEWMLNDIALQQTEKTKLMEVAVKNRQIKTEEVLRVDKLLELQHASSATLDIARIEAEIADSELGLVRAGLKRNKLLLSSVNRNGMIFENGDASYWDKMGDEIKLRQVDNSSQLASLIAQLERSSYLADTERQRIGSSIVEHHRAPFAGLVNATYVTNGTRVTTGTSLLQILDCANPIVIVPIPEQRIGAFVVGMNVTVYPVDSEHAMPGSISYISSGPLIGHDQTLLVQEDLTANGVHAVISFNDETMFEDNERLCESAHRAVVVIHTKSAFESIFNWVAAVFSVDKSKDTLIASGN